MHIFCTRELSPADFDIRRLRKIIRVARYAIALNCHALCADVHQDDVPAAEVLPVDPLQLSQDRHGHPGDAVQNAGGRLVVQVLHDQPLPEVGEEPRALAALRLARQDHRRRLRVELGGAERRGAGRRRVAVGADPEVDGAHHRSVLQILDLLK